MFKNIHREKYIFLLYKFMFLYKKYPELFCIYILHHQ